VGTRTDYPPFAPLQYGFTWVEQVGAVYIWLLQAATLSVLGAAWRGSHRLYRGQVNALLAGILIPVLGSIATITILAGVPWRDLTPWTFALGNLVVAWGLFRRRLFGMAPVARHAVVESMADAVYVLDAEGRVVDLNPAAARAAGGEVQALVG